MHCIYIDFSPLPSLSQNESSQLRSLEYELWYSLGVVTRIRSFCHSSGLKLKDVISKQSDNIKHQKDLPKRYKNGTQGKVYRKTTAILMSPSSTICTSRFSSMALSFIVSLSFSILCITWFVTIGDNILSIWFKWDLDNHDLVRTISAEPSSTYLKLRFYYNFNGEIFKNI